MGNFYNQSMSHLKPTSPSSFDYATKGDIFEVEVDHTLSKTKPGRHMEDFKL